MDNEIWKDVKGYEGIYQVSNLGRIKSVIRYKKIISPEKGKDGYLKVCLTKSGKKRTIKVHRLVAENFISNPDNKMQVNHIDGNKANNSSNNLEWCTQSENMQHAFKNNLIKRSKGKESCRAKAVRQYSKENIFIKEWNCIADAGRSLEIKAYNISSCCTGNRKTAGGYKWKYKNEKEVM